MPPQRKIISSEGTEPINVAVDVNAFFWDRDSHGLFDYDSSHLVESYIKLKGCSLIASDLEMNLK